MATASASPHMAATTMNVSVQVMKVGNRQVTQSMFKQIMAVGSIRNPAICDAKGNLQIEPWGYVNYHADCDHVHLLHCNAEHLHTVWATAKGELRRGIILQDPFSHEDAWPFAYTELQNGLDVIVEDLVLALYVESFIDPSLQAKLQKSVSVTPKRDSDGTRWFQLRLQYGNSIIRTEIDNERVANFVQAGFPLDDDWQQKVELPIWEDGPKTSATLLNELDRTMGEITSFKQNWRSSYETIEAHGQLFIAV